MNYTLKTKDGQVFWENPKGNGWTDEQIFKDILSLGAIETTKKMIYGFDGNLYFEDALPIPPVSFYKGLKLAEIQSTIAEQEQKAQRSSQEITEALLLKQEASQADIDAFNALHSAKKNNQAKLIEVANATSKEQLEAINAIQVEYKNGTWLEV